MRILYFSRDFTPHDHRFLSALAESGHTVFFLRLERRRLVREDRPLPPEIEVIEWKGGQTPFAWKQAPALVADLDRVLERVKPDLVHAGPVPDVAFLAALSGFHPLVSMSWGSDLLRDIDHSRWQRLAARFALGRSQVLLCDCQAVQDKARQLGFPARRVVIFPWGVDLDQFYPGPPGVLRASLGWQDAFVLLSLRSWEPVYGIDTLLSGFGLAAQKQPRLRLLLYGSGSLDGMVKHMIAEHSLQEKVHLGGTVTHHALPEIYRSADLYVSASHSDGSSVSLMESLACGRPALVSAIAGNREWITPGKQGWLFPDGDASALAEGILQAERQLESLREAGKAARTLAEQRADWNKNFRRMLEGYEMAVKMGSGKPDA